MMHGRPASMSCRSLKTRWVIDGTASLPPIKSKYQIGNTLIIAFTAR